MPNSLHLVYYMPPIIQYELCICLYHANHFLLWAVCSWCGSNLTTTYIFVVDRMNFLPPSSFFNDCPWSKMHTFGSLRVCFSSRDERQSFIRGLPSIPEKDVSRDDTCAICQETFLAIIATQEMASVMETPGLPEEDMGVVELPGCAHRFCRKE
ncbi:hypothetical protein AG1IA_04563 [Rhizoctonia solani AG-1 IA]|uniref:RING-type domain-containing protein n=1 Tax=Thanatephorus cucumeris (strain AG1-IA) TaxID=983506 RepID=L8WX49_THACA|nr:hypothetical protein AG1IA_04563 [Rhizoctonia solani AG-1 IA]